MVRGEREWRVLIASVCFDLKASIESASAALVAIGRDLSFEWRGKAEVDSFITALACAGCETRGSAVVLFIVQSNRTYYQRNRYQKSNRLVLQSNKRHQVVDLPGPRSSPPPENTTMERKAGYHISLTVETGRGHGKVGVGVSLICGGEEIGLLGLLRRISSENNGERKRANRITSSPPHDASPRTQNTIANPTCPARCGNSSSDFVALPVTAPRLSDRCGPPAQPSPAQPLCAHHHPAYGECGPSFPSSPRLASDHRTTEE
ncbi:hypothetical protein BKA80DRAFT_299181 [Phyllosticta citrichinensis]